MTYKQAVSEARTLTKRSEKDKWRLAELTFEQVKAGKSERQWAADISVSQRTANRWYLIWQRFGESYDSGTAPTWDEAFGAIDSSGRMANKVEAGIRNMAPARQALIVREIVKRDPEIMRRAVKSDPELATIAREAHLKNEIERRPGDVRGDPVIKRMVDAAKRDNAALTYMDARKYVTELMDFSVRDVAEQLGRQARSVSSITGYQRECDEMAQYLIRLAGALGSMAHGGSLEVVKNA